MRHAIHLSEIRPRDCRPELLKYRAWVLNQRMINSVEGIAQRVEVQLIKTCPWRYGPNVDWNHV